LFLVPSIEQAVKDNVYPQCYFLCDTFWFGQYVQDLRYESSAINIASCSYVGNGAFYRKQIDSFTSLPWHCDLTVFLNSMLVVH